MAACAALALCHVPANAQTAGGPRTIQTFIEGRGWAKAGQIRGAGALGDAHAWLTDADIPDSIRADAASRDASARYQVILAQVGLSLTIEPDDSVSDCHGTYGKSELAPQLCTLIRTRGHFQHALAADGTALRSEARMTVQYSIVGPGETASLPPPPMMPQRWPLRYFSPGASLAQPIAWPKAKDKEVAIMVSFDGERPPRCSTINSSGDPALDKATCDAAITGAYQRTKSYGQLPIIVTWTGKKAATLVPVSNSGTSASPILGTPFAVHGVPHAAVHGDATAYVEVDAAGRATGCRIYASAGSDTADLALCGQLMAGRFTPATDVFGRPIPGTASVPARFD